MFFHAQIKAVMLKNLKEQDCESCWQFFFNHKRLNERKCNIYFLIHY